MNGALLRTGLGLLLAIALAPSCAFGDAAPMEGDVVVSSPSDCAALFGVDFATGTWTELGLPDVCVGFFDMIEQSSCAALIRDVCGSQGECQESGECAAAWLMAEAWNYEERCSTAAAEGQLVSCNIPLTVLNCSALVEHVCGGAPGDVQRCADAPACLQAQVFADSGDEVVCQQLLQESGLSPPCP